MSSPAVASSPSFTQPTTTTTDLWTVKHTLLNGWVIAGGSTARSHTGFCILNIRLYLDAGLRGRVVNPHAILLTHPHWDHCNGLNGLVRGNAEPPTIIAPFDIMERLYAHVKSSFAIKVAQHLELRPHYRLTPPTPFVCDKPLEGDLSAIWYPVRNGSIVALKKPSNIVVEAVELYHSTPTCGYIISEVRQKLKDEFKQLTGKQIAELRKNNTQVSQSIIIPVVAYMCDTSAKLFDVPEKMQAILKCPTVMIECTFIEQDMEHEANDRQHICWTQLKPIVMANPNTTFMLFHCSDRYRKREVLVAAFKSTYKTGEDASSVSNVLVWLPTGVISLTYLLTT